MQDGEQQLSARGLRAHVRHLPLTYIAAVYEAAKRPWCAHARCLPLATCTARAVTACPTALDTVACQWTGRSADRDGVSASQVNCRPGREHHPGRCREQAHVRCAAPAPARGRQRAPAGGGCRPASHSGTACRSAPVVHGPSGPRRAGRLQLPAPAGHAAAAPGLRRLPERHIHAGRRARAGPPALARSGAASWRAQRPRPPRGWTSARSTSPAWSAAARSSTSSSTAWPPLGRASSSPPPSTRPSSTTWRRARRPGRGCAGAWPGREGSRAAALLALAPARLAAG